jgi:hypothetical protein
MNIELHGFLPEHAKDIGEAVWSKLLANLPKEEFGDCIVTVVNDRAYDHNYRNAPFFRIFSDKKEDFKFAAELLKPIRMPGAGMKTFVECVLLADCLELDAVKPKKTEADYNPLSGNYGP